MTNATVLVVDNDPDFLRTCAELLDKEGYRVLTATSSAEARRIFQRGGIQLAVIDVRMQNDKDEKDITGLALAKETDQSVPKIILTGHPSIDTAREVLGPQLDGLPMAVEFVSKQDGIEALIPAVRKALGPDAAWLRRVIEAIRGTDDELKEDHNNARRQAIANYWASLCVAVIGIIITFVGVILVLQTHIAVGVISAIGGVVTEAVSYLFFRRVDIANNRMDRYHRERIEGQRFETLLRACDGLESPRKREYSREHVIAAAMGKWLSIPSQGSIGMTDDTGGKE